MLCKCAVCVMGGGASKTNDQDAAKAGESQAEGSGGDDEEMQKQIAQFKAEMRQIGDEMRSMDNERDAKIALGLASGDSMFNYGYLAPAAAPAPADALPEIPDPPTSPGVGGASSDAPLPTNGAAANGTAAAGAAGGGAYEGETDGGGAPHGRGTWTGRWRGKDGVYDGAWAGGKRHGAGTWTVAGAVVFDGEWEADAYKRGTHALEGGGSWDGAFEEGRPSGRGVWTFADGSVYDGEVKAHLRTNCGEFRTLDLAWSEMEVGPGGGGYATKTERHGRGRFADAATGDVYEGHWRVDQRAGRGTTLLAAGEAEVNEYVGDRRVRVGARWSADRRAAWRLQDGVVGEPIKLADAAAIARAIRLEPPPVHLVAPPPAAAPASEPAAARPAPDFLESESMRALLDDL